MEMLKKIIIVLAITGSCAIKASAECEEPEVMISPLQQQMNDAYAVRERGYKDLLRDFEKMEQAKSSLRFAKGDEQAFINSVWYPIQGVNEYMNKILYNMDPQFEGNFAARNTEFSLQVKEALQKVLALEQSIGTLLRQGDPKKKWWNSRRRAQENISAIDQNVEKLNTICSAIKNLYKKTKDEYEQQRPSRSNYSDERSIELMKKLRAMDRESIEATGHPIWD